jgi:alpha-L-fucosidase
MSLFLAMLLFCFAAGSEASGKQAKDLLKAAPGQMRWWQDARFGMFVCWGPVSLTGREIGWSRGKARPDQVQGGRGPTPAEVYDNLYRQW